MRYYIHAVDGQVYGPIELEGINEWIAQGRVVPTTLLQPEGSQSRIAATTVPGLTWGDNQTFQAYTPQALSTARYELSGSWAAFAASVILCCLPSFGVHLTLGLGGLILATMAYRKGRVWAVVPLILNLAMIVFWIWTRRMTGNAMDSQEMLNRIKEFMPRQ